MKKTLIALAAFAATAGVAHAQSTVTLYGIVDANVNVTRDTTVTGFTAAGVPITSRISQVGVGSGGQNGSRWGMRVSEDLGGGLAAVATIEAGFNADTGTNAQGGLPYGRQVFVGLKGGFGQLSLGRQYSAYDDIHGIFAQANNAFDVSLGNLKNVNNFLTATTPATQAAALSSVTAGPGAWVGYAGDRINNSIKYQSNNYGGFSGALVYGFGENKTATTDATRNVSGNLKYANGPIMATIAYIEDEFSTSFKLKNTLIGGSYDLGVAKLFANFNRAKFTGLEAQKEFSLGAQVPIGAFTLVAQYARSKGDDLGKNTGFGLEGWYDLSKRTRAYASFASAKKEIINDQRNSVFALGVRHAF